MSTNNSAINRFKVSFFETVNMCLIITTKGRAFKNKNFYFNWGVIWDSLNPLILVIGLAILVSSGIRGRGFELEYLLFLLLFWFGFVGIIQKMVIYKPNNFITNKKYISPWLLIISEFTIHIIQVFIRFILCCFVMTLFDYALEPFRLFVAFLFYSFFALGYSLFIASIFHNNSFISDLHGYFVQGMFFLSSIIIPVTRLPETIRDILLYNPLVHLNEWVKEPTTGIYYEYIDLGYFINFLICFLILLPISIYVKNSKFLGDTS
tara:strand:+ start:86 stop:877 length:792 start_codon:yes stop_codon:yes gene_type:complete